MTAPYRKKLIEVAMPLESISSASAEEKSVPRKGHPATLHLWWARRPLATARAVLFGQLVDDPSSWPDLFPTEAEQSDERKRLFGVLERILDFDSIGDSDGVALARFEIARSWARSHQSAEGEAILQTSPDEALSKNARDRVDHFLGKAVPPVRDPFSGGGTISVEALRLGLRAIASDLNPVSVLISKALIELPQRFGGSPPITSEHVDAGAATVKKPSKQRRTKQSALPIEAQWHGARGLAEDVRYYGNWIATQAQERIGHLYPRFEVTQAHAELQPELEPFVGETATVVAWLWARTVTSPDPAFRGRHVPLASSFWLSTKAGKEVWVDPVVGDGTYTLQIRTGPPPDPDAVAAGTKLGRGGNFKCLLSGTPIEPSYIKAEGVAGRLGEKLIAVVASNDRTRFFLAAQPEMETLSASATPSWRPEGEVPARLTGGTCHGYGLSTWSRLFTERQLVALTTFAALVDEAKRNACTTATARGHHDPTGYSNAIATYLAFCVSKSADYCSTLVGHIPGYGKFRSTFARQALPMTWDFAELNPLGDAVGNWWNHVEWVSRAIEQAPTGVGGRAFAANAGSAGVEGDAEPVIISTDPPYYDNIAYADLSDFFYVWLRHTLRDVFPAETNTLLVPKKEELVASAYRHGGREAAEAFFLDGMTAAFRNFAKLSTPEVPAAIYYAFKQSETSDAGTSSTGWVTFLEAVIRAGFEIHGTWPVRTERAGRSIELGTNALASSVVLACRRRTADAPVLTRGDFRRALRQELPTALRALQHGGIAAVDVAQAAIGPGMSVFSRHAKVLEPDGTAMSVRSALQLINEVLDEHLTEQEGEFDSDTRFAVTWYEIHAFEAGPYGEAETLAKARAVAVGGIAEAGILRSGGGKVRLLKRSELPTDWDPIADKRLTVWEATQHLIKRLEEQGEEAASDLLDRLGGTADAARDLAYRLYTACERKGWAEEARAYNGLVAAWSDLEKLAAARAGEPAQQDLI